MAFEAQAWAVNLQFRDRDNNTARTSVYYDAGLPFVDIETAAAALVAAAGALSDAPIVSYAVMRSFEDTAAPQAPEIADVERKGVFQFQLADTRSTSMSIPSLKNTLVVDGTNVINRSDPLVVALVSAIEAAGTDSIGTDIIRLTKAEKRHIKSAKG